MNTTSLAPAPRPPALSHDDAMRLAATEYQRLASTLANLDEDDWHRPTDCPAWDVRQLAGHMVGMAAMAASPLESARQQRIAKREQAVRGGQMIDSLTALQVAERSARTPRALVEEAERLTTRAARGRRLVPGFVRRRTLGDPQQVNGSEELWTMGYMLDVILTRDPWMHRIDLARATGAELELTPEHDGVIVDDVVREWAGRHGRPYRLELSGPAGGEWRSEDGSEAVSVSMDAVDFCRILSGRAPGQGLTGVQVPF